MDRPAPHPSPHPDPPLTEMHLYSLKASHKEPQRRWGNTGCFEIRTRSGVSLPTISQVIVGLRSHWPLFGDQSVLQLIIGCTFATHRYPEVALAALQRSERALALYLLNFRQPPSSRKSTSLVGDNVNVLWICSGCTLLTQRSSPLSFRFFKIIAVAARGVSPPSAYKKHQH